VAQVFEAFGFQESAEHNLDAGLFTPFADHMDRFLCPPFFVREAFPSLGSNAIKDCPIFQANCVR
jgi:hypothetical protein